MYAVGLLALTIAVVAAENSQPREYYEKLFFQHMQTYGLTFKDGSEFVHRLKIFADNIDSIEKFNADVTQTVTLGQNKFTHLTFDEFKDAVHVGIKRPGFLRGERADFIHKAPTGLTLPASVDWSTTPAVSAVKDQGNCGSCWSFSTTGAIEGAYYIKTGLAGNFSEQVLVSCDTTGNSGCNGGWMDYAFSWVKKQGGITTEVQYPYVSGTSGASGSCKSGTYTNVAGTAVTSYTDVATGDVNALMSAVAQQPVSIAIEADQLVFQSYKSGVITANCGQNLDHGVLLVGYGTDSNNIPYWKVKNSWGPSWGLNGYVLIERSSADLCGVLDAPSFPTL